MLQQTCEADPHLERVHPALACRVAVTAVRDGDVLSCSCYRGGIGRGCEGAALIVVQRRVREGERGSCFGGGGASFVVGGHFGGVAAGASRSGVRPLAARVLWGRYFVRGEPEFIRL